jgi:hypothetical protein
MLGFSFSRSSHFMVDSSRPHFFDRETSETFRADALAHAQTAGASEPSPSRAHCPRPSCE